MSPRPPSGTVRTVAGRVSALLDDSLVRNSALLMVNTAILSFLGFVYWAVASRQFPAQDIGTVTASLSTIAFLATCGGLGLQTALVPVLALRAGESRRVIGGALVASLLATAVVAVVAQATPLRPPAGTAGAGAFLACLALTLLTVINNVLTAAFLAARSPHWLIPQNIIGGVLRLVVLVLPISILTQQSAVTRLLASQLIGMVAQLLFAWVTAQAVALAGPRGWSPTTLRGAVGYATGNFGAALAAMIPSTLTPLLVLHRLDAANAAYYSICLMLLALVNVIPMAVSQSLLAENAHAGRRTDNLRRAARTTYVILLPVVAFTILVAPLVLRIFGADYAEAASTCLRVLVAATLITAVNYLVTAAVNSRRDGRGFFLLSATNAVLVVAALSVAAPWGLTALAGAWTLAQAVSALVALRYAQVTLKD